MSKLWHNYYVYITTNPNRTTFYVGVTNDLARRMVEHYANRGRPETWAGKFFCYCLIRHEWFERIEEAIAREKELKDWRQEKKLELVRLENPELRFLNKAVCDDEWPPRKIWGPYCESLIQGNREKDLKK